MKINIELTNYLSSTTIISKETKEYIIFNICNLLYPFAPHISSELYDLHSNRNIAQFTWPKYDEANLTTFLGTYLGQWLVTSAASTMTVSLST